MSADARRIRPGPTGTAARSPAQGDETGARAYFLRIAGQTDFYGLLANEELGYVAALPEATYVPTDEELERAAKPSRASRARCS